MSLKTNHMNQNEATVLLPCSLGELTTIIREIMRAELQKHANSNASDFTTPGLIQKPLYKASELCKLLKVSRMTLHTWTKEGLLKPYKIKSRLFYLWSDVEKLIADKDTTGA